MQKNLKISEEIKFTRGDGMYENILIIEDDRVIRDELVQFLENAEYKTTVPNLDGNVTDTVKKSNPDLILLDVNLPTQDGFFICRQIRHFSKVPIIFITARDNTMDELNGLTMGGDDYITKPYNLPILLARIKSLLKRSERADNQRIYYNGIILNPISANVEYNGEVVELSKTELKIIYYLFQNCGEVVPRIELIEFLWDNHIHIDDNTLSVHMTRLRDKLKIIGIKDFIQTKRGMGYKI
ncbi:two component transcriptional regulator [[Clostridium] sordellii]|uniref:Stage 0 sporulation protein A homolog n=2 Tax=Paraclostridium sordellii TaxID=1505 RepID=A0ABM9RNJ8_PARSO|nr:two-component response regulator [[Clostridium] sordellii] [Paeniclostridium sordellii]CEN69159.1 two component transcriptional regulator [[Clostridium] sordellii] [Paeniclostridium sordellii]CEN72427.1 two component transcriptional regulator [[Clostridium] sordellii] [Paeniclostridium sordellii]CEO23854.1 two component transcriptional regulator [[Clostridium] sordellii] [Paeniclostridium sordellii]CEP75980.1 two component transcriptional regulator [[Clostridium] sordellii] [Paeniclostridium